MFSMFFLFKNGKVYRKNQKQDIFMRAFLRNVCLRPSCYACEFKSIHRQSDITLGDFWGVEKVLPKMGDDKGTSLIFVNSSAGKRMLEELKDKTLSKEVDINEAVNYNSAAIKSVNINPNREKFFSDLDRIEFDKLVKKYCSDSLEVRIKRKIKAILRKLK